jgi:poly-gamma-glutamate synthesis protein (capsule biosynthesis protein)
MYASPLLPSALATRLATRVAFAAGAPSARMVSSLASKPDFVLALGSLPAGYVGTEVGSMPLAVITHPRVPVENVTTAQLAKLLAGGDTDWSQVGAPYSLSVRVLALAGLPLPAGLDLAPHATMLPTPGALLSAVASQPGSLALMPAEAVTWTVRNLGVDGVFPTQGRGTLARAPQAPVLVGASTALTGVDPRPWVGGLVGALALPPTLDLAVGGDIMLGRGVNNKMVAYNDYRYPYRAIQQELAAADLRVANLECVITDLIPIPTDNFTFSFVTKKQAVEGLTYAGFQALTVANNHSDGPSMDGFLDMLETLRQHGIAVCGGGHTLAEARQPALASAKGQRLALLGYDMVAPQGPFAGPSSPGITPVDLTTLPADIQAARAKADLVIPYFHWGIEYTKDPTREQQQAARAAIDAGADMVLGVHPHWVQGIENYKDKLIVYSLGNFIFDQDWSRPTLEGMLLHLYWRGRTLVGVRFVPVLDVDRCQPRPMTQAEAVGVFERMWSGTDLLASGQYGPEYEP